MSDDDDWEPGPRTEGHIHQPTEEADEVCSYCGRYADDSIHLDEG